jgi:hypothetical protein
MSIEKHEQQVLESIERDLARTGPKLAAMLAMFARLTAGEEMPVRGRSRRAFGAPPAAAVEAGANVSGRLTRLRRVMPQLRVQSAWLVWLLITVALITSALVLDRGGGKSACPAPRTAALCRQVNTSAPVGR